MSANTFGRMFVLTSYGESHGPALGAVVDGCPSGIPFDPDLLAQDLRRRRPGASALVSSRDEADTPEVLSGVFQGKTLGTPIAIMVRSNDARPEDYREIASKPRRGHADDMWRQKFGHSDPRGGGRASGRETVARVMGGSVAHMAMAQLSPQTLVTAYARAIGPHELTDDEIAAVPPGQFDYVDQHPARFPSPIRGKAVESLLGEAKRKGLSYGGVVEIRINGLSAGFGQPVFHKLKADLAAAYMGVGATIGIEFGAGFAACRAEGSAFHAAEAGDTQYGGIRGGISTGEAIVMRVGFKPTATVLETAKKGRHDPCIVPRAIPVLEAMTWLVLVDHVLWARTDR